MLFAEVGLSQFICRIKAGEAVIFFYFSLNVSMCFADYQLLQMTSISGPIHHRRFYLLSFDVHISYFSLRYVENRNFIIPYAPFR